MAKEKEMKALVSLEGRVDKSLTSSFKQVRSSLNDLDGATSNYSKSFSKSMEKVKKDHEILKSVIGNTIGNLAARGIASISSAINNSMDDAIARVDTLNSYRQTMQNLNYDVNEVDNALQSLQDGIDGLPTTLPAIVEMQQQYAALTGNISLATDLTVALNDATLAGGQGQEVASRAMEQWYKVIAKGKPDLDAWTSINSAMPAQMNQIAQSLLGTKAKSQDLFEAWKSGKVTTEQVQDALIKLDKEGGEGLKSFADQAQSATGGIATSMANIKTAITTGVANVIQSIGASGISGALNDFKGGIKLAFGEVADAVPLIVKGLESGDFSPVVEKLGHIFEDITQNIDFGKISEKVGQIIPVLVSGFAANIPAMVEVGIQIMDGVTRGLIAGLPKLLQEIPSILGGVAEAFSSNPVALIAGILTAISPAVSIFGKLVSGIMKGIAVFQRIKGIISGFVSTLRVFGMVAKIAFMSISPPVLIAVGAIAALIAVGVAVYKNWDTIKAKASQLGAFLSAKMSQISAWVSQKLAAIKNFFSNALNFIVRLVYIRFVLIPRYILQTMASAASAARQALSNVKQVFVNKLNEILQWVRNKLAQIRAAFAHPITATVNIAKNIKEKISKSEGKAKGGFTRGVTIAGEDPRYPVEAVLSFNPKYRDQNIAYWAKAGRMLGATAADMNKATASYSGTMPGTNEAYSARVGRSLSAPTANPISIASPVNRNRNTVNMGGISFSPTVKVETKNGEKMKPETIIKALRDFEPEFIDFVMQALAAREEGAYVTEGAGLY